MLNIRGGKCEKCGYNKCQAALEFHHLDPSQKEFAISKVRKFSVSGILPEIKSELDKCSLLCKNCHAEEHFYQKEMQRLTIRKDPPNQRRKINKCEFCNKVITYKARSCLNCLCLSRPQKTKIQWPSIDILLDMLSKSNYVQVAKQLGVTDNGIRKHIKTEQKRILLGSPRVELGSID